MCSSMKQPKPDRLVEIDGIPMTVHSADNDICLETRYFTLIHSIFKRGVRGGSRTRSIAPWFIVGRKDTKMAATYKLLIIHW